MVGQNTPIALMSHFGGIRKYLPVSCILKPMTAIPDTRSSFPHSWLLARPREDWPDMFVERIS